MAALLDRGLNKVVDVNVSIIRSCLHNENHLLPSKFVVQVAISDSQIHDIQSHLRHHWTIEYSASRSLLNSAISDEEWHQELHMCGCSLKLIDRVAIWCHEGLHVHHKNSDGILLSPSNTNCARTALWAYGRSINQVFLSYQQSW